MEVNFPVSLYNALNRSFSRDGAISLSALPANPVRSRRSSVRNSHVNKLGK
jgi:hypothetical protein